MRPSSECELTRSRVRGSYRCGVDTLDIDLGVLDWLARETQRHLRPICFGIIATVLAIFGQDLNRWVRTKTRDLHFIFRTLIFVFLCAVGYAWLTFKAAPHLAWLFRQLPIRLTPVAVIAVFVILGIMAERKRKI